jgi:hypothetical protein
MSLFFSFQFQYKVEIYSILAEPLRLRAPEEQGPLPMQPLPEWPWPSPHSCAGASPLERPMSQTGDLTKAIGHRVRSHW